MSQEYWNKRKSPSFRRETGSLLGDRDYDDIDNDLGLRHISFMQEDEKATCSPIFL